MHSRASIQVLIQELESDAGGIARLLDRNNTAWERIQHGADHPVDWGALGFTIQTLYGVLESYFLRICKYFENNLEAGRWHTSLVERMHLEIPSLRHLCGEDLDPRKTSEIQETVRSFFADFPQLHQAYTAKLKSIADAL